MTRPRGSSGASEDSTGTSREQELGSMYDYLAKIILLGPSGSGKSCLLHRFVKNEWRVLSSQTIGVEFSSKIIKVGTGSRRKRIKLQLWDTAGTERFRSVSRSYYRGAAGAILVYDVTSHKSFASLQPFLNDARALASPNLTTLLVGNKLDLAGDVLIDTSLPPPTPSSASFLSSSPAPSTFTVAGADGVAGGSSVGSNRTAANWSVHAAASAAEASSSPPTATNASVGLGAQLSATVAPEGREVSAAEASRWAANVNIPMALEVSAFNGEGIDEVFGRIARMILTKIELGEIDPDDPMSGIQYGDAGGSWNAGASDGASIRSHMTIDDPASGGGARRRHGAGGRGAKRSAAGGGAGGGMALRDWEEVFTLSSRRRRNNCGC